MEDCRNVKVVSPVKIGNNVYVGTRSILLGGITIADNITVGAGAVIGIDLLHPGAYVMSCLHYIEFDPMQKIRHYNQITDGLYEKQKK